MGVVVVFSMGIHHRHSPGQGLLALMVVCDNEIHTQRLAQRRLFHRCNATVHRDDQGHSLLGQKADCRLVQTVALPEPSWNVGVAVCPPLPEEVRQQAGGSDAVYIIVPKHRHALSLLQGVGNAVPGCNHVCHQEGIWQGTIAV